MFEAHIETLTADRERPFMMAGIVLKFRWRSGQLGNAAIQHARDGLKKDQIMPPQLTDPRAPCATTSKTAVPQAPKARGTAARATGRQPKRLLVEQNPLSRPAPRQALLILPSALFHHGNWSATSPQSSPRTSMRIGVEPCALPVPT